MSLVSIKGLGKVRKKWYNHFKLLSRRGYYPDSFDAIPMGRYQSNLWVGINQTYKLYILIPMGRYQSNLWVGINQTYA